MPAFDKATGNAGTMRIFDNGSNAIEFLILCSDGATNVGSFVWSGVVNGSPVGGTVSLPAGFGQRSLGTWTVTTNQTVTFHMNATGTSGLGGPTDHSAVIARSGPPGPVSAPTVTVLGSTDVTFTWAAPATGGSPITSYQWVVELPSGTDVTSGSTDDSVRTATATGLTPGTAYTVRVRAYNANGTTPWTSNPNTRAFTTLPSVPPGMTVTPSASGTSATVTLTPPGGLSGVTQYIVERRLLGGSQVTQVTSPTSPIVVTGLTAGAIYEWRASAMIGTSQSPFTAWTPVQQPNPNTNPGSYFDGSTTDTVDLDYQWTGTVNNSASQAVGQNVTGWMPFASGVGGSGATGAVMRATGGYAGSFAARVIFFTDATAAGFRAGTAIVNPGLADVTGDASYWGSIYVNVPSRDQRLAVEIVWFDAAGTAVGTPTAGVSTRVTAGTWTRLSVIGIAPASAEWAAIRIVDVTGDGWATWKGGDIILLDAAMVSLGEFFSYFDGDTPDENGFVYSWQGTANASVSQRLQTATQDADPLVDPDCEPVPSPPRPPTVPSDCIEDIGVWRRYWATVPASEVSDWLTVLLTLEIETGSVAARQVRIRVYPNPFDYPVEQVNTSEWCSEQIISYIPPSTILTLSGMTQRVWAEVSGGSALNADHLLYGTGGTPATWPQLSCGISYLVSLDVPLDAPAGNITPRVFLTQRT